MKFKVVLIVLLIILSCTTVTFAKNIGFDKEQGMRSYCDSIMEYLAKDEVQKAFDLLEGQWIFSATEIQNVELQTIKQLDLVKGRFGDVLGYKFIEKEIVAEILCKYTYVVKYENHIIRWIFIFYKAEDKWLLNSFKFDDSIEKLFNN
ncbi:phage tail protein [Orenia marismortui]|uniref:DUF4829 domain-containing protein n=1 Tax=Orenia marismortui TaxID=46469 RepID=A0A4R8GNW0_9FIRM|nr:phage tail protein [Orenia marismortui]TDX46338.1 hypothetical protein C7959_1425 [Orenia marismortui]